MFLVWPIQWIARGHDTGATVSMALMSRRELRIATALV